MKSKRIYSIIIVLFALITTSVIVVYRDNVNKSNIERQNKFALLPQPALIDFYDIPSLHSFVESAHLIVIGKVIRNGSKIESNYNTVSGTPEDALNKKAIKRGASPKGVSFSTTIVEIKDKIFGEYVGKEITLVHSELVEEYEVQLEKGDEVVLFLRKININGSDLDNTYMVSHPHASYMFINNGGKVNQIYKKGDFKLLENKKSMKLNRIY